MIRVIILLVLVFSYIKASNCQDTLFSFSINKQSSNVKIVDVLENLAQKCKFSVKTKDDKSNELLNKKLFLVHIEDYTLEDMFNFLFTKNNMFYDYNNKTNILTISYLETKSFVIDYVNLTNHTTETRKSINVGASPVVGTGTSGMNGMNGGMTGMDGTAGGMGGSTGGANGTNSAGGGNSDSTTVFSSSEFTFWGNLEEEINSILSRDGDYSVKSSSIINKDAGMVTITGTMDQVDRVEKYLIKLKDRLHKQVILEAKLIEVTYGNSRSRGVDWSKFQASVDGTFSLPDRAWINGDGVTVSTSDSNDFSYNFSMEGLLNFLDSYGDINVLSTPKIMTLNNQPAVINVGDQINYQYLSSSTTTYNDGEPLTDKDYINGSTFIGLTLNIVPEITDDDFIVLRINPVISDMIGEYESGQTEQSAPDIRIKQLSSIVKAKNGEKVVIGGLVSHSDDVSNNKVTLLGDIPIIGYAFKSKTVETTKKELIIVVIPKIIDYNEYPSIENIESLMKDNKNE